MKGLKSRLAMATAMLAVAGAANAADEQQQPAPASGAPVTDSQHVAQSSSRRAILPRSATFAFYENEMERLSAPSYTPSEHPGAKPAPRSRHSTPSVFDDPLNTASPG